MMGSIVRFLRAGLCLATLVVLLQSPAVAQGYWFLRGDANNDLKVDVADFATVLAMTLQGFIPVCDDAGDANDDGEVNVADAVYLIQFVFLAGPEPPDPGVVVTGPDPTADLLTCDGPTGPVTRPTIDHILTAGDGTGESGSMVTVDVLLEIPLGSLAVDGWSFTLESDSAVAQPVEVMDGTTGAEFVFGEVGSGQVIIAGIMDLPPSGGAVLEGTHLVATVQYELTGTTGDSTVLGFGDDPVDTVTVVEGFAYTPVVNTGFIQIGGSAFLRGECNSDGGFNIADAVFALQSLFVTGSPPPTCVRACDANDDGLFDISDPIAMLSRLFVSETPPLPDPGSDTCGVDPTPDGLPCLEYTGCP